MANSPFKSNICHCYKHSFILAISIPHKRPDPDQTRPVQIRVYNQVHYKSIRNFFGMPVAVAATEDNSEFNSNSVRLYWPRLAANRLYS